MESQVFLNLLTDSVNIRKFGFHEETNGWRSFSTPMKFGGISLP